MVTQKLIGCMMFDWDNLADLLIFLYISQNQWLSYMDPCIGGAKFYSNLKIYIGMIKNIILIRFDRDENICNKINLLKFQAHLWNTSGFP